MPSFYPRTLPRQLPLTPPEFVPSYNSSGCGGMPYQQNSYTTQPAVRQQQDDGYDVADRYGQLSIAMPPLYPQSGTYMNSAGPTLPAPNSYYEPMGATILPPMRTHNDPMHSQQRVQDQRISVAPKEEKPVGGVSAKLDYDMDVMTDFVCEMAQGIIQPGRSMPQSFRKWVHQVLCATRLPSATIVLSLFYLSHRMSMRSLQNQSNEFQLYRMLTIALVLGSKFLDDNTFINRSWSEVSGIPVADLNHLETEWLIAIEFKLHRDPAEHQGWNTWQEHWKDYQTRVAARQSRATKLSPINTSVQRERSFNQNKPLPPLPMPQNFGQPPAYEFAPKSAQAPYNPSNFQQQFDPWNISRSTNEHSPASAPTTGPTTPEYYGVPGTWAPAEGYTRRTMFGIPPGSHAAPTPQHHHLQAGNYGPHAFPLHYNPSGWNAHSPNCGCTYCAQRPPYFMAPGFAPQAVAV